MAAHLVKLDHSRVLELFDQGLSAFVIAKRLGVNRDSIARILRKERGTTAPANPYCTDGMAAVGGRQIQHRPAWIEHDNGRGAV